MAWYSFQREVKKIMNSNVPGSDDQILDQKDLNNIQWREESLSLLQFVSTYPLPQMVQVEEGFDGGSDENSLSAGQILKIHTLTTERKLLCYDRHKKEIHIPLHTSRKVVLRPEDFDRVYQRVADLSKAKPVPNFVEVTRGYYNVDSNVNYELSVDPGEKLFVVHESANYQKKNKVMTFRNKEGINIQIPYDCIAGFKPLIDDKEYILADLITRDVFPFYFEFTSDTETHNLDILKCSSVYDDKLIIASCGHGAVSVVFMIPYNLDVTVKVAVGTLNKDPVYENIRRSFHNFQSIENDVQQSRNSTFFRTSSEISGFTYSDGKKNTSDDSCLKPKWETFDGKVKDVSKTVDTEQNKLVDPLITSASSSEEVQQENAEGSKEHQPCYRFSFMKPLSVAPNEMPVSPTSRKESDTASLKSQSTSTEDCTTPSVAHLTVEEMSDLLITLNMGKHKNVFVENQIDGALFCELNCEELYDLGFNTFEAKKLFSYRDGWRPKLK